MKKLLIGLLALGSFSAFACDLRQAISQVKNIITDQNAVRVSNIVTLPGSDSEGNAKILYSFTAVKVDSSNVEFVVNELGYAKFAKDSCDLIDFTQLGEVLYGEEL